MNKTSVKTSFVMGLWAVSTNINKRIDGKLGAIHGISFTEYMVLFHLKNTDSNSIRRIDLAEKLGLTASGVTRLLAPLEKIGLVQKEINKRDARVSLVKITSTGERLLGDATVSLDETSNSLLENINNKSIKNSLEVFKTMNNERILL